MSHIHLPSTISISALLLIIVTSFPIFYCSIIFGKCLYCSSNCFIPPSLPVQAKIWQVLVNLLNFWDCDKICELAFSVAVTVVLFHILQGYWTLKIVHQKTIYNTTLSTACLQANCHTKVEINKNLVSVNGCMVNPFFCERTVTWRYS